MPVQSVQTGAEFDLPVMRTTFEEMVEGEAVRKNCENCGAPLNGKGGCDYCGTKPQTEGEQVESMIEIGPDRIRIGCVRIDPKKGISFDL